MTPKQRQQWRALRASGYTVAVIDHLAGDLIPAWRQENIEWVLILLDLGFDPRENGI